MQIFQSVILGIIQGVTEFLPISSSAHLFIAPWLLNWKENPLVFDIILHAGTLSAIIVYFRREWTGLFRSFFLGGGEGKPGRAQGNRRILTGLVIASLPILAVGFFFGERVEEIFRSPQHIASALGIFGVALFFADYLGKKAHSLDEVTTKAAFIIGLAQVLALMPGASRSGVTISAALLLGFKKEDAVRFSFMMGGPVILAATVYGVIKMGGLLYSIGIGTVLLGFASSFLSSILAIHILITYIRRRGFAVFALYRVALSAVILTLVFFRY